jgi:hypothetical protein
MPAVSRDAREVGRSRAELSLVNVRSRLLNPSGDPLVDLVGEPADSARAEADGLGEPSLCHGGVQGRLLEAAPKEHLISSDDLQWPVLSRWQLGQLASDTGSAIVDLLLRIIRTDERFRPTTVNVLVAA